MKKSVSTKVWVAIIIVLVVIVGIINLVKFNSSNNSASTLSPTLTPMPAPKSEPLPPLETTDQTPIPTSDSDLDNDDYKDVTYEVCAPIHESMPEYRFVATGVTNGTDIWSMGYVMGLEIYDENNAPILLEDFSENLDDLIVGYHVYNGMMDTMGLHVVDVNFDGFRDVIILNNFAGAHGNTWYDCWLWDVELSSFVASESFAEICNPSLDQDNKCIYSTGGSGADYWGGRIYRYIDGEFVVTNELDTNMYGLVEKNLVNGKMEIVREVQLGDDEQILRNEQEYYKDNELWQLENPRWYWLGGHHADQWLQ